MSMPLPHSTQAGWVVAKARAALRRLSAGTRVIGSAHSGEYGSNMRRQLFKAGAVALHEIAIVETLADHDVQHGQHESAIRSRPQLQVILCCSGAGRAPRVNHNHLLRRSASARRIMAPQ